MELDIDAQKLTNETDAGEEELQVLGQKDVEWGSPLRGNNERQFPDNIRLETTPNEKDNSREATVATPAVGMVYESWEQIDMHFRCYAKQTGFAITKVGAGCRQQGGKATKIYRNVTWRCEQWGEHNPARPKTRSRTAQLQTNDTEPANMDETVKEPGQRQTSAGYGGVTVAEKKSKKCNCPVVLYASASKDGVWTIKKLILEHQNHQPSPSKVQYICSLRQEEWTSQIRRRLFNGLEAGISIPQIHRELARERNGIENFPLTQSDMRNEVSKDQREKLKDGDARAMYAYLQRMSQDNDQFYYDYRLDPLKRLKDVMWVDARSRAAYEDFGDVVCFDSTYITNEYELPFANFVGVNHHGQTLLLGCALISHEDSETFDWLFRNWLACMGGKAPDGLLTDQDAAIRKSVANTMPETTHRWCLWHILMKFSKKLGWLERYEEMKEDLHNVIYDSLHPDEFEERWCKTIKEYKLEDDEWLTGLYEQRHMWIPAYTKHIFWAGMKTTQRSESINSFFDGFVNKKTRLYQFVQQYVNALEYRANDEKTADAECLRYLQRCATTFPVEKTIRKYYTHRKFKEFQVECMRVLYVRPVKVEEVDDNTLDITLVDRVWILHKPSRKEIATEGRRTYKVRFNNATREATCVCKMFESHGLLCRHIIAVYDTYQVMDVPEKYILKRFRKDIKRKHTKVKVAYYDPSKTVEVKRMDKMNVAFELLCHQASGHDEDVALVLDMIKKTHHLLTVRAKDRQGNSLEANASTEHQVTDLSSDDTPLFPLTIGGRIQGETLTASQPFPDIRDPPLKKKVGRKKESRYTSCVEKDKPQPRGRKKQKVPQMPPDCPSPSQVRPSPQPNNVSSLSNLPNHSQPLAMLNLNTRPMDFGGYYYNENGIGYPQPPVARDSYQYHLRRPAYGMGMNPVACDFPTSSNDSSGPPYIPHPPVSFFPQHRSFDARGHSPFGPP